MSWRIVAAATRAALGRLRLLAGQRQLHRKSPVFLTRCVSEGLLVNRSLAHASGCDWPKSSVVQLRCSALLGCPALLGGLVLLSCLALLDCSKVAAETLRHPDSLRQRLEAVSIERLADEVRLRGNAKRGAVLFHTSAAACIHCHAVDEGPSPLGPSLVSLGRETTVEHVVESLLYPSHKIRKGYENASILTDDGEVFSGLIVRQDQDVVVLRETSDLSQEVAISRDSIQELKLGTQSIMPDGLVSVFAEQRDVFDVIRYVHTVASGGADKAKELRPTDEQLAVVDNSADLDHAGILRSLGRRDFEAGQQIYHGYCVNCHGKDGNQPSLPTARAFGREPLRFGGDPYSMFMTLTQGNGLMAPMSQLLPKERYQVVHYIREQFMKDSNPTYVEVDDKYLKGLPEGSDPGGRLPVVQRDYGPALASQLRREVNSALSVRLGSLNIAYDLHTVQLADVWDGGFLDLSETQHMRGRGEGTAAPDGPSIAALAQWKWGHDGTLDYDADDLLPRGPLPSHWLDYRGHHLHGDSVVLDYRIDGRQVYEQPRAGDGQRSLVQTLHIGPGSELLLNVGQSSSEVPLPNPPSEQRTGIDALAVSQPVCLPVADEQHSDPAGRDVPSMWRLVAVMRGDVDGMQWETDSRGRLSVRIPADDEARTLEIRREITDAPSSGQRLREKADDWVRQSPSDPRRLLGGGPLRWPATLATVGSLGLQSGGYALDTITIPESTPWNTWFRTSALDFFDDGRLVVATYGGDIWIVSGIDEQLLDLRWKRFAGGLYEPFGVKVVDGQIYVTCKDRLVRLHDENDDGEADFYESFSADPDVSVNFHAFNFGLQVDPQGNFYYAKSGHGADATLPGAIYRISPDGKKRDVVATGFRTPNGLGMLPDGRLTCSDNQGQWTPASQINVIREGGFYGWVPTYKYEGLWAPDGGNLDLDSVVPPADFQQPMVWMPQEFDSSSGGQVWAEDPRWGPLAGHLIHTSFGKGWMYYAMMQHVEDNQQPGGTDQAAIIKLPFNFRTGIMRARVNPADGQVYACGLDGWNGGGRIGLRDKGIQRLRYTGRTFPMVTHCQVEHDGLRLSFNFELDHAAAEELERYQAKQWNYHWGPQYGSDMYKPSSDQPGTETLPITAAQVSPDGKNVKLAVPGLQPVDQIHLIVNLRSKQGRDFAEEIYWTVNAVPN